MTSLCECGCGLPAPLATFTRTDRGQVKGQPVRYIRGHNPYTRGFRGGWHIDSRGYACVVVAPDHPFASMATLRGTSHCILEHRLVMAEQFGRVLPSEWVIHHEDDNKLNNDPSNLRVFASHALHARWHAMR